MIPEGAAWRSSMASLTVCIFGVTDLAAQDRVVEGARETLRRRGRTPPRFLAIEFWSGEPPPREVDIHDKPPFWPGEPPQGEAEWNAPYAIHLVRKVEIR